MIPFRSDPIDRDPNRIGGQGRVAGWERGSVRPGVGPQIPPDRALVCQDEILWRHVLHRVSL